MQVIRGIQQGTDEWKALKKGIMSASHAQAIASCGKGLDTYILELVADSYALTSDSYNNPDMDRGVELESSARTVYEIDRNVVVEEVTFIKQDDYVGCSPDGLVGDDGLLEIKCPNNKNYFLIMLDQKNIDTKYLWQMQMQMLVSGRKWCDYLAYNPNFEQHFTVYRFAADPEKQEKLKQGFEIGKKQIIELRKKMEGKSKNDSELNNRIPASTASAEPNKLQF